MIEEENGRTRSIRTPEEIRDLLREDLERLDDAEKAALRILIQEMAQGSAASDPGSLFQMIRKADFVREPVDMETFVKDPYYLGNTCDNIYPRVLEDLIELFDGDYEEAVLTGSIGWGKTFGGSIGLCRILYEISCMRDPQKTFGLSTGSNIALVVLSVTENLAQKAAFENITSKITPSPYFQRYFPFEPTKKELRFPHKVWVAPRATHDMSALGLNVIAFMLDESNFMPQTKKGAAQGTYHDMAASIYNALKRRIKSRFERRGKVPALWFVISSKQTSEDFTAKRVAASLDNPRIFVRDYALWEVKPEDYYGANTFPVLVGNDQLPSKILTEDEAKKYLDPTNIPEGAVFLRVPDDYRPDFTTDLEGAIRDIAGVATVAIRPFIGMRNKIHDAYKADAVKFDNRAHPFTSYEWTPGVGVADFIWSRMVERVQERAADGSQEILVRPKISPRAPRHARIDTSLRQDATGICVAHIGGWKEVKRRDGAGELYVEQAPLIVVDFLLKIIPPPDGELILADNRKLIYQLTAHGYHISHVTLDQFQSADTVQTLTRKGYTTELLSVDLTTDPYEALRTALYEDRILFYEYTPLVTELKQLQRNFTKSGKKVKIDHPPKGSKDVSDALAGVVHTLTMNSAYHPLPIVQDAMRDEDPWMEEQRRSEVPKAGDSLPLRPYGSGQGGSLPIMTDGDFPNGQSADDAGWHDW